MARSKQASRQPVTGPTTWSRHFRQPDWHIDGDDRGFLGETEDALQGKIKQAQFACGEVSERGAPFLPKPVNATQPNHGWDPPHDLSQEPDRSRMCRTGKGGLGDPTTCALTHGTSRCFISEIRTTGARQCPHSAFTAMSLKRLGRQACGQCPPDRQKQGRCLSGFRSPTAPKAAARDATRTSCMRSEPEFLKI